MSTLNDELTLKDALQYLTKAINEGTFNIRHGGGNSTGTSTPRSGTADDSYITTTLTQARVSLGRIGHSSSTNDVNHPQALHVTRRSPSSVRDCSSPGKSFRSLSPILRGRDRAQSSFATAKEPSKF